MRTQKILMTGAGGQLGRVIADALSERYPNDAIIVSDIRSFESPFTFVEIDVTNKEALESIVREKGITQIYHLAAILSAKGEQDPLWTQRINSAGLLNVFEVARIHEVEKVFYPSSIAVFGKGAHLDFVDQFEPLLPTTVYGITKVDGELWAQYYHHRYGLDIRSVRYPGVIGYQTPPGGGTTDYAVEIFHEALRQKKFTCFLKEDATLPMIYMEDAIRATMELMHAPAEQLNVRTSYNLAGCSFSPQELYTEIKKHIPDMEITYEPDFRQEIAGSWPKVVNDSWAQKDWGWKPKFDLQGIVADMLHHLSK